MVRADDLLELLEEGGVAIRHADDRLIEYGTAAECVTTDLMTEEMLSSVSACGIGVLL
jgi:hypothetical protein